MLDGLAVSAVDEDGIMNIAISCPGERRDELAAFYSALVGSDRRRMPRLVFGEGRGYQAPRWGDPARPAQVHLDVSVADLDRAGRLVLANGATALDDAGDHRVFADPIGHPFCLYAAAAAVDSAGGAPGELSRLVFDCADPRSLAAFWSGFLGMNVRVSDSPDRVVIVSEDGRQRRLPMLAFQRVERYVPPRWPDPAYPQQMHVDVQVDDRAAAQRLAESLGAVLLPPQGGSCPVYADPAGHPFCLCWIGE